MRIPTFSGALSDQACMGRTVHIHMLEGIPTSHLCFLWAGTDRIQEASLILNASHHCCEQSLLVKGASRGMGTGAHCGPNVPLKASSTLIMRCLFWAA